MPSLIEKNLSELVSLQLIPASGSVFEVFKALYYDALHCNYTTPADYMTILWNRYKTETHNNNTNGKVFESLFAIILYREKVHQLYVQAKIAFVPNVNFDFCVYSKEHGPISLSLKVSLRERYKQADLEAIALKYVHRKSKSFLFTLEENEAVNVAKKILNGDILGIDEVCVVTSPRFNTLIKELQQLTLYQPASIEIIIAQKLIQ
jgi:hypothetical protein